MSGEVESNQSSTVQYKSKILEKYKYKYAFGFSLKQWRALLLAAGRHRHNLALQVWSRINPDPRAARQLPVANPAMWIEVLLRFIREGKFRPPPKRVEQRRLDARVARRNAALNASAAAGERFGIDEALGRGEYPGVTTIHRIRRD